MYIHNSHAHTHILRNVARKVDVLILGGSGGVDTGRPGGAVANSLASELSQIKTTESNILHQLADLRYMPTHSLYTYSHRHNNYIIIHIHVNVIVRPI